MIDYDKLKTAYDIASSFKYWIAITVYSNLQNIAHLEDEHKFRLQIDEDDFHLDETYYDIDELIAKLKELTKPRLPEPKYHPGQRVYVLRNGNIAEVEIVEAVWSEGESSYYYEMKDPHLYLWWYESEIFPTKRLLIDNQIEYWNGLKNEEIILCNNPSMETDFVGDIQGFNKDFCLSLEGQQKIKQGLQELIWATNSEAHNKEWLLINENTDFKVGDEIWRFRSNSYPSETHKPSDLCLESFVIERFDDRFVIAESGDYLDEDDMRASYKSKKDAINAMIKYMEGLKNE